ncbi:MAG: putative toxin-antitoxin system toxin component, PIN family [Cyclobacteriaceae bacterium]|nr:putative toxin-antitoxin system toxin component, PIN family [Cyclobacteriaceae bacterium SS2]
MSYRIVIDTNFWISYLLTNSFTFLDSIFDHPNFIILYDENLLKEISHVALRPKFNGVIKSKDLLKLIDSIEGLGEYIESKSSIEESRDIKDNYLLSLSVDGKANYLISGDNDLLELKTISKTKIIGISELQEILNKL